MFPQEAQAPVHSSLHLRRKNISVNNSADIACKLLLSSQKAFKINFSFGKSETRINSNIIKIDEGNKIILAGVSSNKSLGVMIRREF